MGTLVVLLMLASAGVGRGDEFSVPGGIFPVEKLKPGMTGKALTVFRGRLVEPFNVEILGVLRQESAPNRLVLIRAIGDRVLKSGGIAAGMSGSPVYVEGKLLGAVGFGWEFGDHSMGLVTPAEEMLKIPGMERGKRVSSSSTVTEFHAPKDLKMDNADIDVEIPTSSDLGSPDRGLSSPLVIGGVSNRYSKVIGERLGLRFSASAGSQSVESQRRWVASPGSAMGVALLLGDVTVGSIGTVTAVDGDRFLAFGHPFLGRGGVNFFATDASVVGVIPSIQTPFKLGVLGELVGTVLQDRAQGIYGRLGIMPRGNDYQIIFHDVDTGVRRVRRFRAVADPFVASQVVPPAVAGCVEDLWGRTGQGTAEVSLTVEGRGLSEGWRRTNFFFSDSDLPQKIFDEFQAIHGMLPLNPFRELYPLSFKLEVKVTELPRLLYIERVEVPRDRTFSPGEMIGVDVWLRPWRGEPSKRTFSVKIPPDAKGDVEVMVRGGGIAEMEQESIKEGRRSIDSLEGLLRELSAKEANNEILVEVLCRRDRHREREDDVKLLSEIREERIKEGSLKVLKTNYYVEGLLRVPLRIEGEGGDSTSQE